MCAVTLGGVLWPLLPIPPHFFALAQRNGVEPQRNALKGAATGAIRSRPPLPRTRSPNITADCVKLTLPGQFTHRVQINLTHQFVPLGLTPKWERRAGPPSSCGGFKSAFLWRLDTVSLGKHQRNGVESQQKLTTTSQRIGAQVQSQRKGGTLFAPFTCAPFSWAEAPPPYCQFHPISLLLRKETGWSPKETRFWVPPRELFGPTRLSHGLEAPTSQPTASS